MRIFLCEYITGGGRQDSDLPVTLTREGDLMLSALASDLIDAGCNNLFCTRDKRLKDPGTSIKTIVADKNIWQTWKQCFLDCDAVWIIAPETDNVLYDLTSMAEQSGCLIFGCASEAVRIATSKKMTIDLLTEHKIPCVPVMNSIKNLSASSAGWVIKPDDGVGAGDCYFYANEESLYKYISQLNQQEYIVQEFVQGKAASISLICHEGQIIILGCNEQLFKFIEGKGRLNGIIVNGLFEYYEQFKNIGRQVTTTINGLAGYVGIDLIITEQGPVVLEINPRLTTAYVGLRQSLDCNVAELIMSVFQNGHFPTKHRYKYHPVTINL